MNRAMIVFACDPLIARSIFVVKLCNLFVKMSDAEIYYLKCNPFGIQIVSGIQFAFRTYMA